MINESDGCQDSPDGEEGQEINDSPVDPMLDQFEGVIGAAIEKAVSQYRALLSQGLETEVKRIVTDFEVATADIDQAVARQTRARLSELIEGEVRSVFEDTLGEAERTFADPIWRTARDRHIPYLAPKKSESEKEASVSQTPSQAHPTDEDRVSRPEAPESERENVEGPKPIAAPSPNFWVFPPDQQMRVRVQEEPDQVYPSKDAFADAQQPSTDGDKQYTDAISAIVDDNSDLGTTIHDNADLVHEAANEGLEREPVDDSEPGPSEEINDDEPMIAEALDFENFEEPEWDLPDSPYEISDDWNEPDPVISEDTETAEATVVVSDEKSVSGRLEEESTPDEGSVSGPSDGENAEYDAAVEEETVESPANGLESNNVAANSAEEESVPVNEKTVSEDAAEVTPHADVIEDEETTVRAEVVASVAEGPTLKAGEPSDPENDQAAVFEGTVRLNVEAPGCVKEIVQFVRELRQKPQLRLLRLVGNNMEGVDIWLGLREPLQLGTILPEMQGVTIISKSLEHVGGPDERLLSVRLIRDEIPQNSEAFLPAENPKVVA